MKIIRNDNTEDILRALEENQGYCPCSVIKNNDTKCICKAFRQQEHEGDCHCGLYRKEQDCTEILKIKVKYHADIEPLSTIEQGNWIDLRAAETVDLKKGEYKLISLGVSMELPRGYEAHIAPRSSTYKNFGIISTNHLGIIDSSYCGDNDIWKFPAFALKDTQINRNDRICQFRIVETQPGLVFVPVDSLNNKDRGGFGSTGVV